jgi:hypothetical protein
MLGPNLVGDYWENMGKSSFGSLDLVRKATRNFKKHDNQ